MIGTTQTSYLKVVTQPFINCYKQIPLDIIISVITDLNFVISCFLLSKWTYKVINYPCIEGTLNSHPIDINKIPNRGHREVAVLLKYEAMKYLYMGKYYMLMRLL